MVSRLYHVSEDPNITVFDPRPPPSQNGGVVGPAVWAIDEDHLAHYLLPRDCPRVALRAVSKTTQDDRKTHFPDGHERVVAVEFGWYQRIQACHIFVYELPKGEFEQVDGIVGYHICRHSISPIGKFAVTNAVEEIVRRGYKLRLLPSLWPLHRAVVASTVQFSIIRMRNAKPEFANEK